MKRKFKPKVRPEGPPYDLSVTTALGGKFFVTLRDAQDPYSSVVLVLDTAQIKKLSDELIDKMQKARQYPDD